MTRPLAAIGVLALSLARASTAAAADDWFGRDKALHFGASAALAAGGYTAAGLLTDQPGWQLGAGAGLALAAGAGKELWDLSGQGDPSFRDLAWDAAGTAVGLLVAWALDRWVFGEPRLEQEPHPAPGPAAPEPTPSCAACSPWGIPPLRGPTLTRPPLTSPGWVQAG